MTIKDAFEQYKEIEVERLTETKCPNCKKWFYTGYGDEDGFAGDIKYFTGDWQREYGCFDLDEDVYLIDGSHFYVVTPFTDEQLCDDCEAEQDD